MHRPVAKDRPGTGMLGQQLSYDCQEVAQRSNDFALHILEADKVI